jgi:hypothetical protein
VVESRSPRQAGVVRWKGLFIVPRVESSAKGRLLVEYEIGNRSRYLTAIARLGLSPLERGDREELATQVRLLAMEL